MVVGCASRLAIGERTVSGGNKSCLVTGKILTCISPTQLTGVGMHRYGRSVRETDDCFPICWENRDSPFWNHDGQGRNK